MKKKLILLSLFIYLCATTAVGEVLKIPVLLSHYIEHQENNNSITFATFIYQHYQDDDGDDGDNDRDEQLPFKSPDSTTISIYSTAIPLATGIRFDLYMENTDSGKTIYEKPQFTSPYLASIWQPPKQG